MALLDGMKRSPEPEAFLTNDGEEVVLEGLDGEPRRRLGDERLEELVESLVGVEKNPFSLSTADMICEVAGIHTQSVGCAVRLERENEFLHGLAATAIFPLCAMVVSVTATAPQDLYVGI
jgi:hypothetical protein